MKCIFFLVSLSLALHQLFSFFLPSTIFFTSFVLRLLFSFSLAYWGKIYISIEIQVPTCHFSLVLSEDVRSLCYVRLGVVDYIWVFWCDLAWCWWACLVVVLMYGALCFSMPAAVQCVNWLHNHLWLSFCIQKDQDERKFFKKKTRVIHASCLHVIVSFYLYVIFLFPLLYFTGQWKFVWTLNSALCP